MNCGVHEPKMAGYPCIRLTHATVQLEHYILMSYKQPRYKPTLCRHAMLGTVAFPANQLARIADSEFNIISN